MKKLYIFSASISVGLTILILLAGAGQTVYYKDTFWRHAIGVLQNGSLRELFVSFGLTLLYGFFSIKVLIVWVEHAKKIGKLYGRISMYCAAFLYFIFFTEFFDLYWVAIKQNSPLASKFFSSLVFTPLAIALILMISKCIFGFYNLGVHKEILIDAPLPATGPLGEDNLKKSSDFSANEHYDRDEVIQNYINAKVQIAIQDFFNNSLTRVYDETQELGNYYYEKISDGHWIKTVYDAKSRKLTVHHFRTNENIKSTDYDLRRKEEININEHEIYKTAKFMIDLNIFEKRGSIYLPKSSKNNI